MRNIFDFAKKHKVAFAIIVVCIYVLPMILIHVVYSCINDQSWLLPKWTAGDVLAYTGAFVASAVAIAGIHATISDSHKEQERLLREEVAPQLSVIWLKNGTLAECDTGDSPLDFNRSLGYYDEQAENDEYIIVGKRCSYQRSLREPERTKATTGHQTVPVPNGIAVQDSKVLLAPLYIKNVGRGCAVNLHSGLNPVCEEFRHTGFKTIEPGNGFYIGLYVDFNKDDVFGNYELKVRYYDVLGYEYVEVFPLAVLRGDEAPNDKPYIEMKCVTCAQLVDSSLRESALDCYSGIEAVRP